MPPPVPRGLFTAPFSPLRPELGWRRRWDHCHSGKAGPGHCWRQEGVSLPSTRGPGAGTDGASVGSFLTAGRAREVSAFRWRPSHAHLLHARLRAARSPSREHTSEVQTRLQCRPQTGGLSPTSPEKTGKVRLHRGGTGQNRHLGAPASWDAPSGRPVTPAACTSTPKAGTWVLLSCFTRLCSQQSRLIMIENEVMPTGAEAPPQSPSPHHHHGLLSDLQGQQEARGTWTPDEAVSHGKAVLYASPGGSAPTLLRWRPLPGSRSLLLTIPSVLSLPSG